MSGTQWVLSAACPLSPLLPLDSRGHRAPAWEHPGDLHTCPTGLLAQDTPSPPAPLQLPSVQQACLSSPPVRVRPRLCPRGEGPRSQEAPPQHQGGCRSPRERNWHLLFTRQLLLFPVNTQTPSLRPPFTGSIPVASPFRRSRQCRLGTLSFLFAQWDHFGEEAGLDLALCASLSHCCLPSAPRTGIPVPTPAGTSGAPRGASCGIS